MSRLALVTAAAAALSTVAGTARAQFGLPGNKPFSFGVSGGVAIPAGRLSDGVKSGYKVDALFELRPPVGPFGVRLEGGYQRFETKNSGDGFTGNVNLISGTANAVLRLGSTAGVRPYLIGGVGAYGIGGQARTTFNTPNGSGETTFNADRQTKFGFNGGVGVELPLTGISTFVEARVHSVQTDQTPLVFVPITVGIKF